MRDYDTEEFLIHYGVKGMKRPSGLKYKTRGNGSTSLYANRQSQMYGRNKKSDDDQTDKDQKNYGTTPMTARRTYGKDYNTLVNIDISRKRGRPSRNKKETTGEYFQARTAANTAKRNEVNEKFNSSLAGKLKKSASTKARERKEGWSNLTEQLKSQYNSNLKAAKMQKAVNDYKSGKPTSKKWNDAVNKVKEQYNTVIPANEANKKAKQIMNKNNEMAKLSENMSIVKNYNNIKKREQTQKKLNEDPIFRSEVANTLKKQQNQTLSNLGLKRSTNPKDKMDQTLSNMGLKKKKKKKS